MMTPRERLRAASARFGELVIAVGDDEWELPVPGQDWTIHGLVGHVVVGATFVTCTLRGEPFAHLAHADASILGSNPSAAWRGTAISELEAFDRPDALEAELFHPIGTITGLQQLTLRVMENLVHGHDLATALGVEWEIGDDDAEWLLDGLFPLVESFDQSEHFGDRVEVAPEASSGTRLLALLGRRAIGR